MKKFSTGMLVGLIIGLLLTTTTFALANQPIKLIVNGVDITSQCDVPPQIIDGRTMIPARHLAEALGATVEWDGENRAVVVDSELQVKEEPNMPITVDQEIINMNEWTSLRSLSETYGFTVIAGEKKVKVVNNNNATLMFSIPIVSIDDPAQIVTNENGVQVLLVKTKLYVKAKQLQEIGLIP